MIGIKDVQALVGAMDKLIVAYSNVPTVDRDNDTLHEATDELNRMRRLMAGIGLPENHRIALSRAGDLMYNRHISEITIHLDTNEITCKIRVDVSDDSSTKNPCTEYHKS